MRAFQKCREFARIGLKGWTHRASSDALTFGGLMHGALEFLYNQVRVGKLRGVPSDIYIARALQSAERAWGRDNPTASADEVELLQRSLMLAAGVLPEYCRRHRTDFTKVTWLNLEQEFRVIRDIPGIGKIPLRGKWDGLFSQNKRSGLWLLENKTKGVIAEGELADMLPHDLQVNSYLIALRQVSKKMPKGVAYNIVRRPLLRQRIAETFEQFANRVAEDVTDRPAWYFVRMEMDVEAADLDRFEGELDDLIKDFVDWWEGRTGHYKNSDNCITVYGPCDMLPICANRDFTAFFKRETVFRELEEM